ncbi:MAG: hypothetical protein IIA59_13095 [Candidatus Marinimicrobia bacterium]|nr:hypothetical protein [Candidatus Neomarinimicrobiota bacterium]
MKYSHFPVLLLAFLVTGDLDAQEIKSPEQYFGHVMGADRKLIDWTQITEYLRYLGERSDRVVVEDLGKSTLGKPFLLVIIAHSDNIASLDRQMAIQQALGRGVEMTAAESAKMIAEGKTVVLITLNIHATEIAASQESVELAWELATRTDDRVLKILNNVIILMVPSLNPDGQQMIVDYYRETLGTASEGASFPGLYHHYAGHDNNRDWFFFNLAESRNVSKVLYHDWFPEIIMDQHQMGRRSARLFLPPYQDPINPNVHPRLTAATNMLGKYVAADLTDRGFSGVVTGTIFNAFFEGTMSKTPLWHNRIGILTEAASTRYATPTFHPKSSLAGMDRALNEYRPQTNFPMPWPGGWWRLRDIIEYEKAATYAILDLAATYKTRYKTTFYELNREAIVKGLSEPPYAWVLPADQHDPSAAIELLRRLRFGNVEIYRATSEVNTGSEVVPAGAFVVPLAQANRPYIKDLMEVQHYPDMRLYPGGPPVPPYDLTTWSLPLMMGVKVLAANQPVTASLEKVDEPTWNFPPTDGKAKAYYLERRWTGAYALVNELLKAKSKVGTLTQAAQVSGKTLPKGTFVITSSKGNRSILARASAKYELQLIPASSAPKSRSIKAAKIAIYGPYLPAYDEGWTRYIFDQFGFDYTVLRNKDFASLRTLKQYDVLIMPSMSNSRIVDGKWSEDDEEIVGEPLMPEKYRGGIGADGVDNLKQFILDGGKALFLGGSGNLAIDKLNLPAKNVLKDMQRDDFFAPGTIFEVALDMTSSLTYGMEPNAFIYFIRDPAYTLQVGMTRQKEIAVYGPRNVLKSGWVLGEQNLFNRVALAEIQAGKGEAILYGFRTQNRGQTYGTFKLLFNALYKN